ncbi:hypothetical protein Fmac_028819 [Flemingia macrophylla]|uniref:Uncharacterized protein n=1 Tax=Flemingia macrophylla TaxID=520843 RepID=A0ABD1LA23_9FABA
MDFVVLCLIVLVSAQLFYHFYSLINIFVTRFTRDPLPPPPPPPPSDQDKDKPSSKDS